MLDMSKLPAAYAPVSFVQHIPSGCISRDVILDPIPGDPVDELK